MLCWTPFLLVILIVSPAFAGKCIMISGQEDIAAGPCFGTSLNGIGMCVSDQVDDQDAEAQRISDAWKAVIENLSDQSCVDHFDTNVCKLGEQLGVGSTKVNNCADFCPLVVKWMIPSGCESDSECFDSRKRSAPKACCTGYIDLMKETCKDVTKAILQRAWDFAISEGDDFCSLELCVNDEELPEGVSLELEPNPEHTDGRSDMALALEHCAPGGDDFFLPTEETSSTYVSLMDDQALCLDGTPYGYWLCPDTGGTEWMIWLQGGGLCENEQDCFERSFTQLGSSKFWDQKGRRCPEDIDVRIVMMGYCDGTAFTSNRAEPLVYNGTELYFRGAVIVDATIAHLQANHGLADATKVVLGGFSAGALGVFHHLNTIAALLPNAEITGTPVSGFFLDHDNFGPGETYPEIMKALAEMVDAEAVLNAECTSQNPGDKWNCLFPQYFAQYIAPRWFAINSRFDRYQLQHIAQVPCIAEYSDGGKGEASCDSAEQTAIVDYGKDFLQAFQTVVIDDVTTNGAFISACINHGAFETPIDGRDAYEAFDVWFKGESWELWIDNCDSTDGPCDDAPGCLALAGFVPSDGNAGGDGGDDENAGGDDGNAG
eukprot:CAMPEP_0181298180 /NCGR_PEP_ID=MMETSP1101-20121128/5644_1 /TAXON_ID=46948 /ORGANISM="Rhodomonas abbreviata, Strain Caron Lab Isolate" /LENGTH=601 /DNA_ID=CAMNT_0023403183 /DNA_START=65 /DNA_END=1866 /DNA_ORIENTATION=-